MFAATITLIFAQETMSKYFMLLILSSMEIHDIAITKILQNTSKYMEILGNTWKYLEILGNTSKYMEIH